jgi:hypothetical protein
MKNALVVGVAGEHHIGARLRIYALRLGYGELGLYPFSGRPLCHGCATIASSRGASIP